MTADMTQELIMSGADIVKVGLDLDLCVRHGFKQALGIHNLVR